MSRGFIFLEDDANAFGQFNSYFSGKGYPPTRLPNTREADRWISCYSESSRPLAFVVDLNMSNEYLTPDMVKMTIDGRLTGWIWTINNYSFFENNHIDIVVFSAFIESLDKFNNDCLERVKRADAIIARTTDDDPDKPRLKAAKELFQTSIDLNKKLRGKISRGAGQNGYEDLLGALKGIR